MAHVIEILLFIVGAAAGFGAYHLIHVRNKKAMQDAFSALSSDTLEKNTNKILKLAEEKLREHVRMGEKTLDGKKDVIDGTLKTMRDDLHKVEHLMKELEKDREQKFGKLDERLENAAKVIGDLQSTTSGLRNALSRTQGRGQWGERMAEDVLRLAGFIEGINYIKQQRLETDTGRPDFTFLLPQQLKLNMDVKFPFDNYEQCINAKTDAEREKYKGQFLKDVRGRIRELQSRAYINPEENTVDYVLLFIPNEQVYSFINEYDRGLLDEALKARTIVCSPLTLYAVLGLVRQAVDNFALESKSREMLSLFGKFREQWTEFKAALSDFGSKFDKANKDFAEKVTGVRLRQLERPLEKIDALRVDQGLPIAELALEEAFEKTTEKNLQEKKRSISATVEIS